MWKLNHRSHCSDDLLLAHADGELSACEESRVATHLRECWECRGRLEQLEATAQTLARLAAESPLGGPHRAAAAKASFLTRKREFERELAGRRGTLLRLPLPPAQALAILVALLVTGIALWLGRDWGRLHPLDTLNEARKSEQMLLAQPAVIHQVMNIEVLQTAPEQRRGGGRLEVWAQRGQRYTARWTDWKGELQYAVWRPSAEKAWRYDSRVTRRALPAKQQEAGSVSLMEMEAGRFEELEGAVLDWVRHRTWRPVEMAGDFARFAASGGLALEARRSRTSDGRSALLLTARKAGAGMAVDFTLELDADSYRPRLQQATYRVHDHVLIVRVSVAREDPMPLARVEPGVFSPEAALLAALPSLTRRPPPVPLPLPPSQPFTAAPGSATAELEEMFAAHELSSCIPPGPSAPPAGAFPGPDAAIRGQIEQRLAGLASPLTAGSVAAEATALASAALQEATELQRLAGWATPEKTEQLDPRQWRLLDRMVQDHIARLRDKLSRARGLLEPLLAGTVDASYPAPPHGRKRADEAWAADVGHVLSHLERFERRVCDLFAPPRLSSVDPRHAVIEILLDLPTAEQELGWLHTDWVRAVHRGTQLAGEQKPGNQAR